MTPTEFEILARSLWPRLHSEALRITGNAEEAADVAQDSMLKLWSIRHKLDKMRSVEAFAVVMARNLAINAIRRCHPGRDVELNEAIEAEGALSPEEILIEEQTLAEADAILASLPPAQQTLLRLRHHDGLDNAAIAALIGSSEGAVRTALSRARHKVAELFLQRNSI